MTPLPPQPSSDVADPVSGRSDADLFDYVTKQYQYDGDYGCLLVELSDRYYFSADLRQLFEALPDRYLILIYERFTTLSEARTVAGLRRDLFPDADQRAALDLQGRTAFELLCEVLPEPLLDRIVPIHAMLQAVESRVELDDRVRTVLSATLPAPVFDALRAAASASPSYRGAVSEEPSLTADDVIDVFVAQDEIDLLLQDDVLFALLRCGWRLPYGRVAEIAPDDVVVDRFPLLRSFWGVALYALDEIMDAPCHLLPPVVAYLRSRHAELVPYLSSVNCPPLDAGRYGDFCAQPTNADRDTLLHRICRDRNYGVLGRRGGVVGARPPPVDLGLRVPNRFGRVPFQYATWQYLDVVRARNPVLYADVRASIPPEFDPILTLMMSADDDDVRLDVDDYWALICGLLPAIGRRSARRASRHAVACLLSHLATYPDTVDPGRSPIVNAWLRMRFYSGVGIERCRTDCDQAADRIIGALLAPTNFDAARRCARAYLDPFLWATRHVLSRRCPSRTRTVCRQFHLYVQIADWLHDDPEPVPAVTACVRTRIQVAFGLALGAVAFVVLVAGRLGAL